MLTLDILNSHPVSTLKKEISKTNIKGYSKMKKNEIIELMLKNKIRFNHIVKKGDPPKPKKIIKIIKDKKVKVPTIKITEAEEEKGGGAADPKAKQFKIPKPTSKIRIVPKKPKARLGESGIGNKRKREPPKPRKKKIIDVYVKPNKEKTKPKPKIPTITITEEPKPKKKVIKVGGRFITPKPKEVKSKLPPIPKFSGKIILPKGDKPKGKGKAKAKDPEELQDLSKFKKKSGDKGTTDSFISAIEKRQKEDEAKMEELKKARAKETERLIKALEAQKAGAAEDDEPDEIPYKDFKLIEGVPKNIKKIFYEYVDDRTSYANAENQRDEIEELQRIEKNYIEAEAMRKNKSLSAKKQMKAVQTIGSILIETRNDINNNPDLKKIYKVFTPAILKRVLDQKKKDDEDLKKEQKEIEKQEKEDAKALKKAEAAEKKKSKN